MLVQLTNIDNEATLKQAYKTLKNNKYIKDVDFEITFLLCELTHINDDRTYTEKAYIINRERLSGLEMSAVLSKPIEFKTGVDNKPEGSIKVLKVYNISNGGEVKILDLINNEISVKTLDEVKTTCKYKIYRFVR